MSCMFQKTYRQRKRGGTWYLVQVLFFLYRSTTRLLVPCVPGSIADIDMELSSLLSNS